MSRLCRLRKTATAHPARSLPASAAVFALTLAVTATLVCGCGNDENLTAADLSESAAVVSVRGPEGTQSFTLADLRAMEAVRGYGGYTCPPTPGVTGPTEYAGVALADLAQTVGGLVSDSVVSVAATDGYVMTYTADQILNGTFVTYDPVSGEVATVAQAPRLVLAYETEGELLSDEEGPLRAVFLTPDPAQVVEGFLWVKWVDRIQVRSATDDWSLVLAGPSGVTLHRESFAALAAEAGKTVEWEDINGRMWSGVPLYALANLAISGQGKDETPSPGLGLERYTVEIVGEEGKTVSVDGADIVDEPGYLVANALEGNPLGDYQFPLCLVGARGADEKYLDAAELFVPGIVEIRLLSK